MSGTDAPVLQDVEKDGVSIDGSSYAQKDWHHSYKWSRTLLQWGLETRGTRTSSDSHEYYIEGRHSPTGITPVPVAERVDTQYSKIFFIWLSANFNILSYV